MGKICNYLTPHNRSVKRHVRVLTDSEGWKFKVFFTLLKNTGAKLPAVLEGFCDDGRTFRCRTADNKILEILLSFKGTDNFSGFHITEAVPEGSETNYYDVLSKDGMPLAYHSTRTLKGNGKMLNRLYSNIFCVRELTIGGFTLCVELQDFYLGKDAKYVLRNLFEIDAYLFGLNLPVSAKEVYENVVMMLKLSEEELRTFSKLSVSYYEGTGNAKVVLDEVCFEYGIEKIPNC
ncbi:MAG: hypothetical protein FWC79_00795 [Oscillospiraceae bacterium]|nr:hypothetical protein [Oscillospiraceae bacterium]